jgi:membrane-bound metal-dependent hydrolase YbcI (DUF457 family)
LVAGHAGLALLAKAARPRIRIAVLLPVTFAPDILGSFFDAFGYHNRALSHSLVSVGLGASIVALIYFLTTRVKPEAFVVWLTYVSHWPADFITGTKPTWPGGPDVGLRLYDRPVADAVLECAIVVVCWIVYRRSLKRSVAPAAPRRAMTVLVPMGLIIAQVVFDVVQQRLVL